jgi:hypothetical protein
MADRRHRQAGLKELGDQRLQDIAFEVFAHSPRTMAAGEQQAIEAFDTQLPPGKRGLERRIEPHLGIGPPCVRIRPRHPAERDQASQSGQEAPEVQALARQHDVVRASLAAGGRGEHDRVTKPLQRFPADSHLGRIKILARDWNEHGRHDPSPPLAGRSGYLSRTSASAPYFAGAINSRAV